MRFSINLWDALFGKKIELEMPSHDGTKIKRKVSKKWFEKMKTEGQINEIEEDIICVHIINPVSGTSIGYWTIGKDIDEETVNKFRDPQTNDLYALIHFENGEPQVNILKKDFWEESKKLIDSV